MLFFESWNLLTKFREGRITGSMRRFSQVIDDLELRDFPVQGGQYTWKGGLHNCTMARLDRFLVSEEWDCLFGRTRQSILPRSRSFSYST